MPILHAPDIWDWLFDEIANALARDSAIQPLRVLAERRGRTSQVLIPGRKELADIGAPEVRRTRLCRVSGGADEPLSQLNAA